MTSCVLLNIIFVGRKRFSCVWCIPHPPQVVETSCPIKGVMCTRKGMHKECNKSVVTQLTRVHMGYLFPWQSVVEITTTVTNRYDELDEVVCELLPDKQTVV